MKRYKVKIYREIEVTEEEIEDYPGILPYTKACERAIEVFKGKVVDIEELIHHKQFFVDVNEIT